MVEKKEVLDYLRNKQKAIEIEAKVNGINLWVLLGAISVVSWNLLGSLHSDAWTQRETISRALLCEIAFLFIIFIASQNSETRDEIRYAISKPADLESPFLLILLGVFLASPSALYFISVKPGPIDSFFEFGSPFISALTIGLFGIVAIPVGVICLISRIFAGETKYEGLLEPSFVSTRRESATHTLFIVSCLLAALIDQASKLHGQFLSLSPDEARVVAQIVALHLLAIITITRLATSQEINWTYEMETDLVLGTISPDVAIKRIENKALGPRLQDVMNKFLEQLDEKLSSIDTQLSELKTQFQSIEATPREATIKRAKQIQEAIETPIKQIDSAEKDCEDLEKYLKKLAAKQSNTSRPGLSKILPSLDTQHAVYKARVITAREQLDKLVMQASD